eukprot:CAMPEP_0197014282 /NCGR_PEP_ID=MMETSP1380-20130617/69677_1 /TAXON_ID=5936 /ORGANISM="Euplotes crassus, Strain CT5" /LENGTH=260 /DNA_ID=CAMNT_0042439181 /DNA_START=380 /DNA_END=1160 /DNA_ORIENTATION=+
MSVDTSGRRRDPLDVNDKKELGLFPTLILANKLFMKDEYERNIGMSSLPNSGKITPLKMDRSYDSKRYMRVDDIDVKRRGKIIVPVSIPQGLKKDSNMIEYKGIPKQRKLLAQQGRLPFTRRYTKEKYGNEQPYNNLSLLHHENQTERDIDPEMRSRRFKAELRRAESTSTYNSQSVRSIKPMEHPPSSHHSQIMQSPSLIKPIKNPKQSRRLVLKESSRRISPSKRKFIVNTRDLRRLPPPPEGYEYFEEVSEEESEEE